MAEPRDEALVERLWTREDARKFVNAYFHRSRDEELDEVDANLIAAAVNSRITALSEQVARLEGELKEAQPIIARAWDRALTPRVDEPVEQEKEQPYENATHHSY